MAEPAQHQLDSTVDPAHDVAGHGASQPTFLDAQESGQEAQVGPEHSVAPTGLLAASPRRSARLRRPLPAQWTHRTAQRSFTGPLAAAQQVGAGGASSVGSVSASDIEDNETALALVRGQHPLEVLWLLTRTDFRARYRSQALGVLWSLLNPLVMMGLISVVFTHVFRSTEPFFPVFLLIGLIIWQWVTGSLPAVTTVFVTNADLIKRTIFARQLMPIATILSYGLHCLLESLVVLLFIPIFPGAFKLTPALLLVPVFLLLLVGLLSGAALAVSVLNVIYRDVAYIVTTSLLLLYWLTPVFYPMDVIPFPFRTYLQCNPIAGILTGLRRAIMHGDTPSLLGWAGIVVPTALMMIIGWRVYRHYEHMVLDFV